MTTVFRTGSPELGKLLEQIDSGGVQLPDFQRSWVWDDDHIRSLIASVSMSYPIGSVILLQAGGDENRFKARPLDGAPRCNGKEPDFLILDGQQRLTSLYRALWGDQPVETRTEQGKKIERFYYLNIVECLDQNADREDAIASLPPSKELRKNFNRDLVLDISDRKKEHKNGYFPLNLLFDFNRCLDWMMEYQTFHTGDKKLLGDIEKFKMCILAPLRSYCVPSIELTAQTPRDAVCQVFEKVNTGGVQLSVFELVTASFATDKFNLREDWETRREVLHKFETLKPVEGKDFLQAVTLLANYRERQADGKGVSCKRKDTLKLKLEDYRKNADLLMYGFECAAGLLKREKIFTGRDVPYNTQLVPLAATCAHLGEKSRSDAVQNKLARWYWCGVFGELYGSSVETRFGTDIVGLVNWLVDGGDSPQTIIDANFVPGRLLTLTTRNSAAYKGMMGWLMQKGSKDFLTGDEIDSTVFLDRAVDIHHVFPKAYCQGKIKRPEKYWNSIINKAPLTAKTNRALGGDAPSKYLAKIEEGKIPDHEPMTPAPARLNEILQTHLIDPELLRGDEFNDFILDRASRLLDLVEEATGKPVEGRDSEEVREDFGGSLVSRVASGSG